MEEGNVFTGVCPFTGGYSSSGLGVPYTGTPRAKDGVPPPGQDVRMGTPSQVRMGYPPPPSQVRTGVTPRAQNSRTGACYAAGDLFVSTLRGIATNRSI